MEQRYAIHALSALAQDTRLSVFRLLVATGPEGMPAGDVARRLGVPANTMSVHLGILERAGLITSRRESRSIIYSPDLHGARDLIGFLLEDCCRGHPEICAPVVESLQCGCASMESLS